MKALDAVLPWPLPAVLAWAAGWAAWLGAGQGAFGFALGVAAAAVLAARCTGVRRKTLAAAGFPLSALAGGAAAGIAPWTWLALLLPLLALYPPRAWRDAPLFPTPAAALQGLPQIVGQPAQLLDAGCGLGHGMQALHALWPQARLQGLEWSPLLAWLCRLRCRRFARVRRADMWAASWAGCDLVYLFQRPESMARAWAKACAELAPGAWLVSLEFEVPGVAAAAVLRGGTRPVWAYRVPTPAISGSTAPPPDR